MPEDSIEPLVTECPSCGTRFRVTESQLEIAAGKVRCGSCLEVFLGMENFVLDDDEADLGEDANEALDALLSELAGDSTDVFGVPRESPAAVDDEPDAEDEHTLAPMEFEVTPADLVAEETVAEDLDDSAEVVEADSVEDVESIELVAPPELPGNVEDFADLTVEDIEFVGPAGEADASPDVDDSDDSDEVDEHTSLEGAPVPDPDPDTDADREPGLSPEFDLVPMEEVASVTDVAARTEPEPADKLASEEVPELESEAEAEAVDETLPDEVPEAADEAAPEPELDPDPEEVEEIVLDEGPSPNPSWAEKDKSAASAEDQSVPTNDDPAESGPLHVEIEPAGVGPLSAASRRRWIPLATIVATLALIVQVFWSQREEWSKDLSIRPIYEFSCRVVGCDLAPLRAVDAIYSKNLVVRQHPDVEDALMVDALVINGAHFEQPYPVIELRFSSIGGRTVAGRRFQPEEYLAGEATGAKMIGPNTPVHISLSIKDPGAEAVNYVMLFH